MDAIKINREAGRVIEFLMKMEDLSRDEQIAVLDSSMATIRAIINQEHMVDLWNHQWKLITKGFTPMSARYDKGVEH
jgi:hypothetical protein